VHHGNSGSSLFRRYNVVPAELLTIRRLTATIWVVPHS